MEIVGMHIVLLELGFIADEVDVCLRMDVRGGG
jgi:hypothetical protein